MTSSCLPVVIVGGGLSGLTAAVQLGRLGIAAVLFDDGDELGGRARTDCRAGFHLNCGPHRLFERGAAVRTLRELDVAVDVAPRGPNGGFAVWRGRKYTLPVGFCSLLTTGLLRAPAKRELARLLASLRTVPTDPLQRVAFDDWLLTHAVGSEVVQIVRAMVRHTTYCNDMRQSATAALEQLRLSVTGAVLYVHRGWGSLVDGLRAAARSTAVDIVRGCRVVELSMTAGRARIAALADGTRVAASAVIIASAPHVAERLLQRDLGHRWPARVAVLDVALRKLPEPRGVFAVSVDEPWSYSADSAIVNVAPQSGAVVHLAKYLPTGAPGSDADERQLEAALDLLQPGWRSLVVYRRFVRSVVVSHAIVAATTGGFAGRPTAGIAGIENVFLAGDWVGPVGQLADASVASGAEAARHAARILGYEATRDAAH